MSKASAPIGIFDSGIGGLTVAKAIKELLPNEQLIYFGDTAHMPYGDKSTAAIQSYAIKICNMLLSQEVKLIVIACNTASAAAYDLVKAYVGSRALVIDVIEPMVQLVARNYASKEVGLIGTKSTINSNTYKKKIDASNAGIHLQSLATPLLAPMIEEGFFNNKISNQVIEEYLSKDSLKNIEALILGCTHYPLIKEQISAWYKGSVDVIDSSMTVAKSVEYILGLHNLLQEGVDKKPQHQFFISDYTDSFAQSSQIFFGETVKLESYPLWE